MKEFKIGTLVSLPNTKYPGVTGTIISQNGDGYLVRFNGIQQLYFIAEELELYVK